MSLCLEKVEQDFPCSGQFPELLDTYGLLELLPRKQVLEKCLYQLLLCNKLAQNVDNSSDKWFSSHSRSETRRDLAR